MFPVIRGSSCDVGELFGNGEHLVMILARVR